MKSNVAVAGLIVAGAGLLAFSQRAAAQELANREGAAAFTQAQKDTAGPAQRRKQIVNLDSLIPDVPDSIWDSDGMTLVLEHPLAATNSAYAPFKFSLRLVVDVGASGAYENWSEVPDVPLGDYTWEITRQGGSLASPWTVESSGNISGILTKANVVSPVSTITPTWETVVASFGGYQPNYAVSTGEKIIILSGDFSDTYGGWKYVNADGNKVSEIFIKTDLSGNTMNPQPIQLMTKCEGQNGVLRNNPVTVTRAMATATDNGTLFYPPWGMSYVSGLSYGCACESKTKTLPSSIRVVDFDTMVQTAAGEEPKQIKILDKASTAPSSITLGICKDGPTERVDSAILRTWTASLPKVGEDTGGLYIYQYDLNGNRIEKIYISQVIPGFDAMYARRSVDCSCPSGSANAGQTVTIYDTNNCPNWSLPSAIDEHCGGAASGGGSSGGGSGYTGGGLGGSQTEADQSNTSDVGNPCTSCGLFGLRLPLGCDYSVNDPCGASSTKTETDSGEINYSPGTNISDYLAEQFRAESFINTGQSFMVW